MKSVLFYWSKGANVRRKLMVYAANREKEREPYFLNSIAAHLNISRTAAKKHLKLLLNGKFLTEVNPGGKPVFLRLTKAGKRIVKELSSV